ncbi:MAG: phytanoyl-CoA dioxygenase family protein [Rubrivivax sp.]|nr:phytanoyl-CoA dioxygenase family protein [Rubrivivax sp.]
MPGPAPLDAELLARWHRDGFLSLPGFTRDADVVRARQRAQELVALLGTERNLAAGASRFSTRNRSLVADQRLLASAHQVHAFFEEEAFDADGRLVVPAAQAINKIGHALHALDPVFGRFSCGPALAALAGHLGLQQPQVWQSQLIFKQPRIGGEVGWHQDASFFVTEPITVTTFWFALEDATLDNGCLWVEPGGHRGPRGVLREQYVNDGGSLQMRTLDSTPWPDASQARPLPVPAGTLVLLHGLLPHYSAPNRSAHSRLAYTLHVTDGIAPYSPLNWLQRGPALPVRGLASSLSGKPDLAESS